MSAEDNCEEFDCFDECCNEYGTCPDNYNPDYDPSYT